MDLKAFMQMQAAYTEQSGVALMELATGFSPVISLSREELGKVIFLLLELKKYYSQKIIPRDKRDLLDNMVTMLQTKTVALG